MIHTLRLIIFLIAILPLAGQSDLPLGTWKSHLSYREGSRVTQSKDKIIYAAGLGMILIDKSDLSVSFLSKEDGLTDIRITGLYYDRFNDQLILVYADSGIDIVRNGTIINIPSIKSNTSIIGSKTINHIYVADRNIAYISTDFGILGFNTQRLEFTFTAFTGLKVNAITQHKGILYAGTEEGLFTAPTEGINLTDFGSWKQIPHGSGLPQSYEVSGIVTFNETVFLVSDRDMYYQRPDGAFSKYYSFDAPFSFRFISAEGKSLITGVRNNQFVSKIIITEQNLNVTEGGAGCINLVIDGIEDETGRMWYADQWRGIRYTENYYSGCKVLEFNSPWSNTAGQITFSGETAILASGGINEDYGYANSTSGFYLFEKNRWTNFNGTNLPVMDEKQMFNVQAIQQNPVTKELYIGSYWNGLLKFNPESKATEHFNKDNSVLRGAAGDESRTRISHLLFDDRQNLWISNFLSPRPLVLKTKENEWYSFALPGNNQAGNIAIDRAGNKWVPLVTTGGSIVVFNENGTPAVSTDDKVRLINRNNSEISSNRVNCVTVDADGLVWVGTASGPVVFDVGCADPFSESCRGSIRRVVVDGIPAPLLRDEDVLAIAVDGGNNKWFGTRNGIFVQTPDGSGEVMKFDVNNSPLLDNIIRGLFFNERTGEMFIVSSLGIQSYRTITTGGGRTHAPEVFAFPNPVRPDYNGPIAIKGLVRDASVKITDINGRLVYETKAQGGQAVWDGRDYNGVRAATGVYLVFSANENTSLGVEALVTKILVVQ
jgi:hypothetical protein